MRAREKSLLMGEKVLVNSHAESKKKYLLIKRILDIILGYIGIVVASPIFLLIILVIRIIDGSGTIYKQIRIGRYGKEFYMYKFRTMKKGCNSLKLELTSQEYENYKENYKLDNDRRVTKLGEVLRKSSLDELLQLFNIIRGDMSFVGPRPVLQEETELYGKERDLLLSIRPGLTGYWQVNGRSDTTYSERMTMELYYCENFSFIMDTKIFLKTFFYVFTCKGAK